MAKETIGELAIGIGLDFSMLEADLGEADQTLKSALSRINANTKTIKLETEIDLAKLGDSASAIDVLRAKERGLTREIEEQNKAVKALQINREYAQKTFGADNWQTRKATNEYLKQVAHVERLNAQLRRTQASLANIAGQAGRTSAAMGNLGGGASAIGSTGAAFGALTSKLLAFYAAAQTVRQGLEWVSQGVDLSARVYDLSRQFGATESEMVEMLGIFDSAKVDAKAVFGGLAKTLEETSDPASKTAKALASFGVSLRDAQGNALSTHDALFALANGFKRAEASGRQMEFLQAVPRTMRQYVDLLQKFPVYLAESQKVTRAVIDPEAAATIGDDLRTLDLQTQELKKEVAAALLPVALEYVPKATQAFGDLVKAVEANKAPLQTLAEILAAIVGVIPRAAAGIGELVANIQNFGNGDITGNPFEGIKDLEPATASLSDFRKEEEKGAEAAKDYSKGLQDFNKILSDSGGLDDYEKKLGKLTETLENSIFKATHTDIENRLHEIEQTAERQRQELESAARAARQNVPQAMLDLIDENAERQKSKAMFDFQRTTLDSINSVFQTDLEKRLNAIDREKEAWLKKGVDEVTATKAAEEMKRQAYEQTADQVANTNRSIVTSEKQALQAFRKGGTEGLERYYMKKDGYKSWMTPDLLKEFQGAKKLALRNLYGDPGLNELAGTKLEVSFSQASQIELIRGVEYALGSGGAAIGREIESSAGRIIENINFSAGGAMAERMNAAMTNAFQPLANGEIKLGADGIESRLDRTNEELRAIRESQGGEPPSSNVTVNVVIESAVTQDSAAMRQLADTVADQITPAVEAAIGQSWNSYAR